MPEERLSTMLAKFFHQMSNRNSQKDSVSLIRATIVKVMGGGTLLVDTGAETVIATPITDEPYEDGQFVWVSNTSDGFIAHGGAR